jgi:heme exporter protein CcmD
VIHFFAMGGYALYLWPSYGLTLLAVGWNLIAARRALQLAQRDARRRLAMHGANRAASP